MSARFHILFVLMFPDDSEKALKLKNNKTEFEQFLKEGGIGYGSDDKTLW